MVSLKINIISSKHSHNILLQVPVQYTGLFAHNKIPYLQRGLLVQNVIEAKRSY